MGDSLAGLPSARAVLGSIATLHRVFGLARLGDAELEERWTTLCRGSGVDPIFGPTDGDEGEVEAFAQALPKLREAAAKRAKKTSEKAVAGLLNVCGYDDIESLDDDEKAAVEFVRWAGKGQPTWDPAELPRLRLLELHDNGLDDAFFESFSLEDSSQLLVVTLHGNRLEKLPPLSSSVKYVSLRNPVLQRKAKAAIKPVTAGPEAEVKLAGQMLQGAAVMQLMVTGAALMWALSLFVYSFGLCCPFLALPIFPIVAAVIDLSTGTKLASGQRVPGAHNPPSVSFTLSVFTLIGLNFMLLLFPLALIPVVLEFLALSKLGRKDVRAYLAGQDVIEADDHVVKELADAGVDEL